MPIKIQLNKNIPFRGSGSREFTLPSTITTIGDLLEHIGKQIDFAFIDTNSGELKIELEILVNGKDVWFYPTGLNTPLKDGNLLEIYLIPLGGG